MGVVLSGAARLFPIVGDPVAHTQSPVWLTRSLATRGHAGVCVPLQTPEGSLQVVMAGLTAAGNVDGVLVTMPHKHAAYEWCASSDLRAGRLGAVSVMRRNPDRSWHGDMLDGLAFVRALEGRGAVLAGRRALLVGAGAAGSAIACALADARVAELTVHDADPGRAAALCAALDGSGTRVSAGGPDPAGFDLVLNATPAGLAASDPPPVDLTRLTVGAAVGDVVARDGETPLVATARRLGCLTADGHDMVAAVQHLMVDFMLASHPGA